MPVLWIPRLTVLADFRVEEETTAQAIEAVRTKWERIKNSNVVSVHFAFSSHNWNDSSLIIVSDYHPASTTLLDKHLNTSIRGSSRIPYAQVPENLLWSYMVQIANALKAIHGAGLVARLIEASKILVTDEKRIRFNGSAIADILDPKHEPIANLQRLDLESLGRLIFSIGTATSHQRNQKHDLVFTRSYSQRLRDAVDWLVHSALPENNHTIDHFVERIASDAIDAFDASLRLDDQLQFELNKELENGRLVRLLFKLNCINERPEYATDPQWAAQGLRAPIGLFRDFVFHQVDAQGRPVIDMGHMLSCLNKLDVGLEEKITLTTRNDQTVLVVTYREMKAAVESAWGDLTRGRSTA